MTKTEILALLKENQDERGIAHWKKLDAKTTGNLKSYGIGLTKLRKLAKQIGRDHQLARQLWKSNHYGARVLGLLIDNPKQITREQAEQQVEQLDAGMLAHVFASCDATLAKAPFADELSRDWMESKDHVRRRCGYTLLYELSKKNIKAMDDAYFMDRITCIRDTIQDQEQWVREAMKCALMGIGKRNIKLNRAAIAAARAIGPIEFDNPPANGCEPFDPLKHLTSVYLKQKFAKSR
jgi:3-methyladenine DNA glycosylase AlkD